MAVPTATAAAPLRTTSLGAEIRTTLTLAWPLVLAQLGMLGIILTDTLVVGRLGADALAAISIGAATFDIFFLFGMGFTTAVPALAARAFGARQPRRVRRVVRQGLWVALLFSIPMLGVLMFGETIMLALGQDPAIAAAADEYVVTVMWMLPFGLGFFVLRGFASALGRPRPVLWVLLAGLAVNALLDYLLVFGAWGFPRLGLAGAGLATTLAGITSFIGLAVVVVAARPFRRYEVFRNVLTADWPLFRELIFVGVPIGLTVVLEAGIFIAAAFLMGILGAAELAAHQMAVLTAGFTFMIPLGISQAATVLVGQAHGACLAGLPGAGQAAIRRAGVIPLGMGCIFAVSTAFILWFGARPIVGLFLDLNDPANAGVIEIAVVFLRVAALFQIVDATQGVAMGALRGLADTRTPLLIGLIGFWGVGFSASVGLGFTTDLAGVGVWIGLALGLLVVAVAVVVRFFILTAPPPKIAGDAHP